MKIAFISHSSALAGAERALVELVPALRARGVVPLVVLPSDGPLRSVFADRDVECRIVPYGRWVVPSWTADDRARPPLEQHEGRAEALAELLRPEGVAAVYSNTSVICVGALAAKRLRLPHLWHLHELNPYLLDRKERPEDRPHLAFDLGLERSLGMIDALSACCVFTSQAMARAYTPYMSRRKTRVVHQAVTLDRPGEGPSGQRSDANRLETDDFRLAIVGTLVEWKRQEDVIRAVGALAASGHRVQLSILGRAGDPGYERHLRELVVSQGIEEEVTFLETTDSLGVIEGADCLVHCSRREAFGRVTVEAMLLGRPVVGAADGATPEVIRHRWTGYLYEPLNPEALAHRVATLIRHPGRCARMGRRGRRRALRHFGPDRYARRMARILRSIVK